MGNQHCDLPGYKKISWTAVIAGALTAIGLSFLLNLFSIAIGLSVVTTNQEGITSLAIGGFIGILIGTIIATFVGGAIAGYLGRPYCERKHIGALYGFISWCLALILMSLVAAQIGDFVARYTNFINQPSNVVVVNNETTPAVSTSSNSDVVVNAQKATNNLGYSAFLIFVLFFAGAVSSCFGGHLGMACVCNKEDENAPRV
jgi:hypothetical protein